LIDIEISTADNRQDIVAVHRMLSGSYWSENIPLHVVEDAIANSFCIGAYSKDGSQVGFARLVTDYATFAYLCDVIVDEGWRGQGIGKQLVAALLDHSFVTQLRCILLATRDAHSLYERFGFTASARPASLMELTRPDIYASHTGRPT
jgi:ribosomal protein S18 acetylase RimI-like enzyme